MLSERTVNAIRKLQQVYPEARSALIPALHLAQAEIGYLPLEAQQEIAALFALDLNDVHSVVTFYDMFHEEPVGKHVIHVCKNASCMLRGCDELLQRICEKLGIRPGETTADGQVTVIASECLAACDRAPMALVDEKVVGPIALDQIDNLIEEAKRGHGHPSPITVGEVENG